MKENKSFIPEDEVEFEDYLETESIDKKTKKLKTVFTAVATLIIVLSICLVFLLIPKQHNVALMRDGAGIHFNDSIATGESLHFMSIIPQEDYERLHTKKGFKTGIIYIATSEISGELTLETPSINNYETTNIWKNYDSDSNKKYASLFIEITDTNYKISISVRSYVIFEGKTYYSNYSNENNSRSAYYIAKKLQNDSNQYNKLSDEQKVIIDKYSI